MKRASVIYCLIGPAGSGKTTNLLRLLEEHSETLKNSVSVTTREPRENEKPGRTREFVSKEEFQELIDNNLLFEHENIHGNFYGTRQSTLDNAFNEGYDLVFDIDIQGALNLKSKYPDNVVITFLSAPSDQELIERIKNRSQIDQAEIEKRMETANFEYQHLFDHYGKIDYFIVNQDKELTYQCLNSILIAERLKTKLLSQEEVKCFVLS